MATKNNGATVAATRNPSTPNGWSEVEGSSEGIAQPRKGSGVRAYDVEADTLLESWEWSNDFRAVQRISRETFRAGYLDRD